MRDDNEALKEGKKKLEFAMFDLVNVRDLDKQKLKRIRARKEELELERDGLREDKKALKLEFAIYDLLKLREVDKQKLLRIRAICDE